MKDSFVIYIDKELEGLIPGFLENRRQDLIHLEQAICNHDFNLIRSIGHKMKGSSGGYGFHELSLWGKNLEEKAQLEDEMAQIKEIVFKISNYLNHVKIEFRKSA